MKRKTAKKKQHITHKKKHAIKAWVFIITSCIIAVAAWIASITTNIKQINEQTVDRQTAGEIDILKQKMGTLFEQTSHLIDQSTKTQQSKASALPKNKTINLSDDSINLIIEKIKSTENN